MKEKTTVKRGRPRSPEDSPNAKVGEDSHPMVDRICIGVDKDISLLSSSPSTTSILTGALLM